MMAAKRQRDDSSGQLQQEDCDHVSEDITQCVVLDILPSIQHLPANELIAEAIQPFVAQLAALSTAITGGLTAIETRLASMEVNMREVFVITKNSMTETLHDTLIPPSANHGVPPAAMARTVHDLIRLQAGPKISAIERNLNLAHTGTLEKRINCIRRAYGCRRIL